MLAEAFSINVDPLCFEPEVNFKHHSEQLNLFHPFRYSLALLFERRKGFLASRTSNSQSAANFSWWGSFSFFCFDSTALKFFWKVVYVELGDFFFRGDSFPIADKPLNYVGAIRPDLAEGCAHEDDAEHQYSDCPCHVSSTSDFIKFIIIFSTKNRDINFRRSNKLELRIFPQTGSHPPSLYLPSDFLPSQLPIFIFSNYPLLIFPF